MKSSQTIIDYASLRPAPPPWSVSAAVTLTAGIVGGPAFYMLLGLIRIFKWEPHGIKEEIAFQGVVVTSLSLFSIVPVVMAAIAFRRIARAPCELRGRSLAILGITIDIGWLLFFMIYVASVG